MISELPLSWVWATVADVAHVQLGRQRSPQHHAGEQMRPYLRAANITWQGISLDDIKMMNFDDVDFAKYKLEAGDILLNEASGSSHEVGKPAIWRNEVEDCCFQNTLLRLRPQLVDRNYVYWYCYASALTGRLGEAGRGVNIRHLGKRGLAQFRIPVAPLAEQERIVTAIEEHLSRLDTVNAALQAIRTRLGNLRRSAAATILDRPDWLWTTLDEIAAVRGASPRTRSASPILALSSTHTCESPMSRGASSIFLKSRPFELTLTRRRSSCSGPATSCSTKAATATNSAEAGCGRGRSRIAYTRTMYSAPA